MNKLLRSRTGTWFECKVYYQRTMDDGLNRKVKEVYIVDAISWAEAEARLIKEMSNYISGVFEIIGIKKCNFKEVFFDDSENADCWFKAKLQFITINEKTQREKRSNVYYLVNAATIDGAKNNVDQLMSGMVIDYVVASISDTPYMDVYEYNMKQQNED